MLGCAERVGKSRQRDDLAVASRRAVDRKRRIRDFTNANSLWGIHITVARNEEFKVWSARLLQNEARNQRYIAASRIMLNPREPC